MTDLATGPPEIGVPDSVIWPRGHFVGFHVTGAVAVVNVVGQSGVEHITGTASSIVRIDGGPT